MNDQTNEHQGGTGGHNQVDDGCGVGGQYKLAIGNEKLDFFEISIEDPMPTGRQILLEIGYKPVEDFLVFQMLKSGELEEIRLDETTDLRKPDIERFLVFRSDRSFNFLLDGTRYQWGATFISGASLKKLVGVDPNTYGVWQEFQQPGVEDKLIQNQDLVDLSAPGVERFFTGRKQTTEG